MTLLLTSLVLFLAIFAIRFSKKSGVPALLLFILLGMIFNRAGFHMENFAFAEQFTTVALMIIMFQGGFSTNWKMVKPVAAPALVFSSLGVVATALLTGLFCHLALGWDLLPGMLIGSVVGSTDYASVSNILRSKNLNLKYNTAPLLELESGSNDPFAYTMTMIFLSLMLGDKVNIPLMIILQVGLGLLMGFVLALGFYYIIKKFNLASEGLFLIFVVASSLLVYALTTALRGNGYLAIYIYGLYLGNKSFKGKRETIFFYEGVGDLMQIALFFMLGLLSSWDLLLESLPAALAIMLFMFLVARPLAIYGLAIPFKLQPKQKLLISLAGLRGAAAIAFAIIATNSGVSAGRDIYNTVFGICVISTAIQGFLMPQAAEKLDMLDPNDTVLRNFNDYQDRQELGFIKTRLAPGSPWIGEQVQDIQLTFDIIVAKISRQGKVVVPKGNTVLQADDVIVLGGESYFDPKGHELVEFTINAKHPYVGKQIKDLELQPDELIVMVQRQSGELVVPQGDTVIKPGDVLTTISEA